MAKVRDIRQALTLDPDMPTEFDQLRRSIIAHHLATQGPVCPGYGRAAHPTSARNLTVDHILPQVAGGSNERSNLTVLCRSCNARKHARIGGATSVYLGSDIDSVHLDADELEIYEAMLLTGQTSGTLFDAMRSGRLNSLPPAPGSPPHRRRIRRTDLLTEFPIAEPLPVGRHVCGVECSGDLHVTYLSAIMLDRDWAEYLLREAWAPHSIGVEMVRRADVPVGALPSTDRVSPFVVVRGSPGHSAWRVTWRS